MSVEPRKLAVAILLAIPVCYSQSMGQDWNSPGNIGQKINGNYHLDKADTRYGM